MQRPNGDEIGAVVSDGLNSPDASDPTFLSDWLKQFQCRYRRRLRVLHIGNIANNAYNNAKIQRAFGIEAYVLCHDYYHTMSCPEWEDADFEGDVGDENLPDWWAVELKGFRRPRWFAQGPLDACIRYLLACVSDTQGRGCLWQCLEFERWLLCGRSNWADFARRSIRSLTGTDVAYVFSPGLALLAGAAAKHLTSLSKRVPFAAQSVFRLAFRLERYARSANLLRDRRHLRALRRRCRELTNRAAALLSRKNRHFEPSDLNWFFEYWWHPYLRRLFAKFDVIQAYGICPPIPMIAGVPYLAYEHGTIRAIPFQENDQGRMCAVSYLEASTVFITNSDNLLAADRLGIEQDRVVCLPHAFDSTKLERFAKENENTRASMNACAVFLNPSRQNWVGGDTTGWGKGNDRFLQAAACLRAEGMKFRILLIEWGQHLEDSKKLVNDLRIDNIVTWLPAMRKKQLWKLYLSSHCIVDQFLLPAIGGVAFEAMMLGRRVITALDQAATTRFFGEAPPLFACQSVTEIADAMRQVISDPADTAGRGQANLRWMKQYHSAERIVRLQLKAYQRLIADRESRA